MSSSTYETPLSSLTAAADRSVAPTTVRSTVDCPHSAVVIGHCRADAAQAAQAALQHRHTHTDAPSLTLPLHTATTPLPLRPACDCCPHRSLSSSPPLLPSQSLPLMWCGIDSSTQSLKVMLVDSSHLIHHEVSVNFDASLSSSYPIRGGITRGTYGLPPGVEQPALQSPAAAASLIVTSPTLLFVQALEMAFDALKAQGAPLQSVVAISGSGQQHGSVYWGTGAAATLRSLSPQMPLHLQLKDAFAIPSHTQRCTHPTLPAHTQHPHSLHPACALTTPH